MADKRIDQLTELTTLEANDLLVAYDVSELGDEKIRKITKTNAFAGIDVGDVTTAQLTSTSGVLQTQINNLDLNYATDAELVVVSGALNSKISGKEDSIGAKGTAFNKNFGTVSGTIPQGDHTHGYLSALSGDNAPSLGGDLDVNGKNIKLTSTPASDDGASGFTATMTVDVNAVGIGAALYMASDGNFEEADADTATTMPCTALAIETSTGSKKVLLQGFIRHDAWTWTPGGVIYVSQTQGTLTQTAPSAAGKQVQRVGFATHADRMFFNPDYTVIEI